MPPMSPNEKKLRLVLSGLLGVPSDSISDATSKDTVDAWDSVKHLNIVLTLEEQFGVSFDEEVAFEIESVPQIRTALINCGVAF
jgi:acyl carrier protein